MMRIGLSIQKFYLLVILLAIILFELLLWVLHHLGRLTFDAKIDVAGLTAIPLFLIGIFELYRQTTVRRASFITEYVSKFYTEQELHLTFNDLIATYHDIKFESIKKAVALAGADGRVAAFGVTTGLQDGRVEGSRFYHPDHFQGSPEEQRLDALLGYFDVIGYQYEHGGVRMADVVGMLGYQLSIILTRQVIAEYLEGSNERWWKSTPQSKQSALVPYIYLRALLAGFKEYNVKYQRRLEAQFRRTERDYERLRNRLLK